MDAAWRGVNGSAARRPKESGEPVFQEEASVSDVSPQVHTK
jgi:hypothetical protein